MVNRASLALVVTLTASCWTHYTVGVVSDRPRDAARESAASDAATKAIDAADATDVTDVPPCDGGTRCGGECVDLASDANHCGACGVRCRRGCAGGLCGESITALAVGTNHTCVTRHDGSAVCWGRGAEGQLGDGRYFGGASAVSVSGAINATHITAGDGHSCMLQDPGRVFCWGNNASGQIGDGTVSNSPIPMAVSGMVEARGVSAGLGFSCAIDRPGSVWCWGDNQYGQLGIGTMSSLRMPSRSVALLTNATVVASGRSHTCAVQNRLAYCWGRDDIGALGRGVPGPPSLVPGLVMNLTDVADVGAGDAHSCALKIDGTVWCWGSNQFGELGDDGVSNAMPRPVEGLANIQQIAVAPGQSFSCALDVRGQAWCWGDNQYGQLGRETITPRGTMNGPEGVHLPTGTRISIVRAGGLRACGVLSDTSAVLCWGYNESGTLGVPESTMRMSAMPVRIEIPADL